jgi:hypothetical protein
MRIDQRTSVVQCPVPKSKEISWAVDQEHCVCISDDRGVVFLEEWSPE